MSCNVGKDNISRKSVVILNELIQTTQSFLTLSVIGQQTTGCRKHNKYKDYLLQRMSVMFIVVYLWYHKEYL